VSTALAAPALAIAALALLALVLLLVLFLSITLIVQSRSTRPRDHAVYLSRQPYWVFLLLSRMLYWASLFSRLKPAPLRVAEVAISCIHSQVSSVCVSRGCFYYLGAIWSNFDLICLHNQLPFRVQHDCLTVRIRTSGRPRIPVFKPF
jgi:hypothetical protein